MNTPSTVLGSSMRNAADIAAELRRDFLYTFQAEYERAPAPDPVLSVLLHALAVQIGRVYQEAEDTFPWQVLDDLMAGLAMPRPMAAPAQTVAAFSNVERRERVGTDTALQGNSRKGEQFVFAPDVPIEIAPVSLRFAAVAEGGRLHVVPGAALSGGLPWPPGSVPCQAAGGASALLLAIDTDEGHCSSLGLHIKTGATGNTTAAALARSPWYLLDADGVSREEGTLRSTRGRGGVNMLSWFHDRPQVEADDDVLGEVGAATEVGAGPFGEQLWVFPTIPTSRRWRGRPPTRFVEAIHKLTPEGASSWMDRPLVWLYVPLPAGTRSIANTVQGVTLNTVTASNIEVFTEHVNFPRTGQAVSLRPEGQGGRHIMGVLSVIGEGGTRYVPESDLTAPEGTGRLRLRDDRIEMRPARRQGGRLDGYAVLRLLLCDGERGNDLEPGSLTRIITRLENVTAQVTNLTVSRGGAAPPTYDSARLRFAELLRTRERVVTGPDFDITARAFDPRIEQVTVQSVSEVAQGALQPVDDVHVTVPRSQLPDPEADVVRLRHGLERHFERRSMMGRRARVTVHVRDDG